jgi:hypothetical protein
MSKFDLFYNDLERDLERGCEGAEPPGGEPGERVARASEDALAYSAWKASGASYDYWYAWLLSFGN